MNPNQCIIIGAGISGMSAAQLLRKNGFEVKILEANSRIGGRICPVELQANLLSKEDERKVKPITIQCGANWVHDLRMSNPIYSIVSKENLTLFETHDGDILFSNRTYISDRSYYETHSRPRIYSTEELAQVNSIGSKIENQYYTIRKKLRKQLKASEQHQVSLADTINRAIYRISNEEIMKHEERVVLQDSIQQLLYLHYQFMGFSEGYELNDVSFTRWFDIADEDFEFGEAIICEGTSRIIQPLSESLDITLNCRVTQIDWSELYSIINNHPTTTSTTRTTQQPMIHIHTSNGSIYSTPHVILTPSIGVLQSNSFTFL